jgi:hypothetical protein
MGFCSRLGESPNTWKHFGLAPTQVLNSVISVLLCQEIATWRGCDLGSDGFWDGDYGWGVRVRRHLAHAGGALYGTELDLEENWFLLFSNQTLNTHTPNTGQMALHIQVGKVPGSSRVPAPPWVGSRSPDGWDQIPYRPGGWVLHQTPWSFGFDSPNERNQGKQANPVLKYRVPHGSQGLGSSSLIAHVLHSPPPPREQLCNRSCSNKTHAVGRATSALTPVTEIPRTVSGTPSIHHDEETITFYDSSANLIMESASPQGYHRRKNRTSRAIEQNRTSRAIESKGRSLASKIDTLVRHSIDPIYRLT